MRKDEGLLILRWRKLLNGGVLRADVTRLSTQTNLVSPSFPLVSHVGFQMMKTFIVSSSLVGSPEEGTGYVPFCRALPLTKEYVEL